MDPYLVVDISNSFTKAALVREGRLGHVKRTPTSGLTAAWLRRAGGKARRAVLGSVVPARNQAVREAFDDVVVQVSGTLDIGMPVDYPRKKEIGADRLANAIAGRELYGAPCVLIDFGTAVTFDVVDTRGAYCGGVIATGLHAMTDYLHERTALLPRVDLREPRRVIGRSTREAMLSGAVIGYRGLIREVLAGIRTELGRRRVPAVACGGYAELVAKGLPEIDAVNPLLTLEGLRIIGTRHFA